MAKLVPAFNEVIKDPAIVKSINADGYDMIQMTPAQMDAQVIKDLQRWGEIIKKAGVKDE
jgi:tripartite-type tricarboxylate transporter receptor subunit TctC